VVSDRLLPFEELWPRVAKVVTTLATEEVAVEAAWGRVLRTAATAAWDLPRVDTSAMDGWAVRSWDTVSVPACLAIADANAYAGRLDPTSLAAGTTMPIATGGRVPDGADAVAPKEIVHVTDDRIEVTEPVPAGRWVRRRAEELAAGDEVVTAGQRLDALHLAAVAAAGVTRVTVGCRPRVAIVGGGDEVVAPGTEPRPGEVVDVNGPFLERALARLTGAAPPATVRMPDDRDALRAALADALGSSDVVLVSGGVSVGDRDLVKQVLEHDLDVERVVWRVAVKPGKPMYVGRRGEVLVVGLPGNPGAVIAHWTILVRPLLLTAMGATDAEPTRLGVRLALPVRPNPGRTWLRWARLERRGGDLWADVFERAESHMLTDLARADALVVVPAGDTPLATGTTLEAVPLDRP
jgi:molybdopterin molybdotransferase